MSEFFKQESKWWDDEVKVWEVYDALKDVDKNDELVYMTLEEKQRFEDWLKAFAEEATLYIDKNGMDDEQVTQMVAEFNDSTREYVQAYLTSIWTDFQYLNTRLGSQLKKDEIEKVTWTWYYGAVTPTDVAMKDLWLK